MATMEDCRVDFINSQANKVSIIIPTYNGAATIKGCLEKVFCQETSWKFDVHVTDSGSTDGTLEILKTFPVNLTEIPNRSFNHGKTRNEAANHVDSEFIVFLVQDAEPVGKEWLTTLVSAVEKMGAAGAFGSQQPRIKASLYTRWVMSRVLPVSSKPVIKRLESPSQWNQLLPSEKYRLAFFDDTNSCIRREVLLRYPFREIPYGEDIDWAARILQEGYSLAYEPSARVIHSHERSAKYVFKRAYSDHSLVNKLFELTLIDSNLKLLRSLAWSLLDVTQFGKNDPVTFFTKASNTVDAAVHIAAQVLGTYAGARSSSWFQKYPSFCHLDKAWRQGV